MPTRDDTVAPDNIFAMGTSNQVAELGNMDLLIQTLETIFSLVTVVTVPTSSLYWQYLGSALLIALSVVIVRDTRTGRHRVLSALRTCLPASVYATRSFRNDLGMCLVNIVLFSTFLGSLLLSSVWIEEGTWRLLYGLLGQRETAWNGPEADLLLTLSLVLAADLAFFISHYLQHKVPMLWRFHAVHHSAEKLNPLTAFRRHPVDLLVDGNLTGLLTGIVLGLFDYFSLERLDVLTIAGANAGVSIFLYTTAHLQHTHIWLSFGSVLNRIFVSPAMHQIHHSVDARHVDTNMGNIFSIWDAVAGTLYLPAKRQALNFGLVDGNNADYDRLSNLYAQPFIDCVRQLAVRLTALRGFTPPRTGNGNGRISNDPPHTGELS